jgi:hypothetical protein
MRWGSVIVSCEPQPQAAIQYCHSIDQKHLESDFQEGDRLEGIHVLTLSSSFLSFNPLPQTATARE